MVDHAGAGDRRCRNRNRRACEDHKQIFDAVLRRNVEGAAAMQRHMDNAYALYIADVHASMLK